MSRTAWRLISVDDIDDLERQSQPYDDEAESGCREQAQNDDQHPS